MHPSSACVGFIRTCNASISSSVLPSLAKNSAMQTTWVVFLLGILASLLCRFEGVVQIESFLGRLLTMHDGAYGLDHGHWRFALEDVTAHVDACGTVVYGSVGHRQGFRLGQFLASGDDERNRAACGDARKAGLTIVGLNEVRAEFGAHARCEAKVLGIAHEFLAYTGNGHGWYAMAIAVIDDFDEVADGFMLVHAANVHLHGQCGGVEAYCVFDIHRDAFVGEFLQDALAAT